MSTDLNKLKPDQQIVEIFRCIKWGEAVTREDLSNYFNITKKTVTNYVNRMRERWNVDIKYNRILKKYVIKDDGDFEEIGAAVKPLNANDVNIILCSLIESRAFMPDKMQMIEYNLLSMIPKNEAKSLKEIFNKKDKDEGKTNGNMTWNFEKIREAIVKNNKVRIRLRKTDKNSVEQYTISPYSFACHYGRFYIIAECDEVEGLHNFYLDKIVGLDVLNEEAKKTVKDFDLENYLRMNFYMFRGSKVNVKVKFNKAAFNLWSQRRDLKFVSIIEDNEDYFICDFTVFGTEGIKVWLLGFGENAKVIEPDYFKEDMKKTIEGMLQKYKNLV